ncbi:MAG TPA: CorA family divalent cation transporter [Actinomycetota bacterium]|nr:CorA family divalent cation transporter [Actinomycetota bacterium]
MATGPQALWISRTGARSHEADDIPALLRRKQGFLWLDLPSLGDEEVRLLQDNFNFDANIVRQAGALSLVPRLRRSSDHLFLSLHSLDPDRHLIEIGQFIGPRFLVTTHVVRDQTVSPEAILRETTQVRERILHEDFRPESPVELSAAIVGGIARRLEEFLGDIAGAAGSLDRRMREGKTGKQQEFLEEVYRVRHELITVRNRAAQNRAACARTAEVAGEIVPGLVGPFEELAVRLQRLGDLCDGEREFLQDLLDYYASVLTAKMNIAMERLALIVVLLAPTTIATGIYGMNIFIPGQSSPLSIVWILSIIFAASAALALWAKRQGWL